MAYQAINFAEKFSRISDHWQPHVVAAMNDYQFKLVKVEGEFVWHSHTETDEAFIVIDGELDTAFRDGSVTLQAGEMYVVPKGIEHRPVAKRECAIMLIEPASTTNTGDAGGDYTAAQDQWI